MTLTRRIWIGFLILYIGIVLGTIIVSVTMIKSIVFNDILTKYEEHFKIAALNLEVFFKDIESDLITLSQNEVVRNMDDALFTSFLNVKADTFEYHYTDEERAIIQLFSDYRSSHPQVNSVYMGRENGSFVRSHPRTQPTSYDPRERLWYQLAKDNSTGVQLTPAYPSVTNNDVNIGSVLALKDDADSLYGVIGMDVTIVSLSERMNQMVLSYDGHLEFCDDRGIILITPWAEHLNKPVQEITDNKILAKSKHLELTKIQDFYVLSRAADIPKGQLIAYVPIQNVDQTIANSIAKSVFFITVVIFLVAISTYYMVECIVLKPLRNMKRALKFTSTNKTPQLMSIKAVGEINDFQIEYNQLIHEINREENELEKIKLMTITSLAALAEMRDYETGLHIVRTQKYLELIGRMFNQLHPTKEMNEKKLVMMIQCAPLHDIGKVAIPDYILLKPDKLTEDEFEIMKMHTVYGKETIEKSNVGINDRLFIDTAINIVYYHHECWNGTGYPEGLEGNEIPIEARIMSVADVYDALTSKRVYKEAINHEQAIQILKEGNRVQFDPDIINAFCEVEQSFKAISEFYREND